MEPNIMICENCTYDSTVVSFWEREDGKLECSNCGTVKASY